jgi:hypothetical protein
MSFDPYSTRSGRLGDFPAGTLIARLIALMPRTHRELADIVGAPDAEVRNALDTGIRQGRVIREPGRPAVYRAATEAEFRIVHEARKSRRREWRSPPASAVRKWFEV